MGKRLQTAILFIPGFSIYAVLILFSIVLCFYYSFFDWDGIRTSMNFVGFSNYIRILKQPAFLNSLRVTFFFAVLGTFAVNTIALFLSLQLNKPGKLTYFYRSAFFFPQLISLIAVGFIFKSLLSYIGVVNTWLEKWGLPLVDFLGSPAIAKWSVLFVTIWQITGFGTVLYLAGLQAIPKVLTRVKEH